MELARFDKAVEQDEQRRISGKETLEALGMSRRNFLRLSRDYREKGTAALRRRWASKISPRPVSEEFWLEEVRAKAIDMMMAEIRKDLAALNVRHDEFRSERALIDPVDKVAATIATLRAEGKVYEGRLPPPKGAPVEDWEDREQTLFRATDFGDDVDRPLMKSDGSYTYFASDIAYHRSKIERGFRNLIDVWGADHGGYIKRMKAAVAAVSGGTAELDVKVIQLVKLLRAGEPVKMSKRSGDFVTLREVVDEVGPDAVRFMMLYRKNDAVLDFDLAKVKEQSRDNPVFYVQYAHARARSVLRHADEELRGIDRIQPDLHRLTDSGELALIKLMAGWPRLVESAAEAHEPHRIAFYLYDLAAAFHALWNRGKEEAALRFLLTEDPALTSARLAMVRAMSLTIASGLGIFGVEPVEEMR